MAPDVVPEARRAQVVAELPVFVDPSGWRRRALQGVALVVGCACVGYLLFVGALVTGLRQPVGTHPPSVNGPAPSGGPESGKSVRDARGPARAGDRRAQNTADSARSVHETRRPPSGRSVPPPTGHPRQ